MKLSDEKAKSKRKWRICNTIATAATAAATPIGSGSRVLGNHQLVYVLISSISIKARLDARNRHSVIAYTQLAAEFLYKGKPLYFLSSLSLVPPCFAFSSRANRD